MQRQYGADFVPDTMEPNPNSLYLWQYQLYMVFLYSAIVMHHVLTLSFFFFFSLARLIEEYSKMSEKEQAECRAACSQFRLMVSGSMALPG